MVCVACTAGAPSHSDGADATAAGVGRGTRAGRTRTGEGLLQTLQKTQLPRQEPRDLVAWRVVLGPRRVAMGRTRQRPELGGGPGRIVPARGRVCFKPSEQHSRERDPGGSYPHGGGFASNPPDNVVGRDRRLVEFEGG